MPRLSIDVSAQEHQQLKALAALKGVSIKEFVLRRTIGDAPDVGGLPDGEAVAALRAFLEPRIAEARAGKTVAIESGGLLAATKARLSAKHG